MAQKVMFGKITNDLPVGHSKWIGVMSVRTVLYRGVSKCRHILKTLPHSNLIEVKYHRCQVTFRVRESCFRCNKSAGAERRGVQKIGTIYKKCRHLRHRKGRFSCEEHSKHLDEFFCDQPHTIKFYFTALGKTFAIDSSSMFDGGWPTGVIEGVQGLSTADYRRNRRAFKRLKLVLIGGKTGTVNRNTGSLKIRLQRS